GSVVMAIGLVLISTLTVETSLVVLCAYICLFGLGIGMSMQILTLIVQNTFPNAIVGTATAANNYFRQVGATLGSAVVGSVFASRPTPAWPDRKSTRLNSSHVSISYAVFCLKKKK